jgi:sulfite exporter TauE/SafE
MKETWEAVKSRILGIIIGWILGVVGGYSLCRGANAEDLEITIIGVTLIMLGLLVTLVKVAEIVESIQDGE